jgi:hypothetical protein
MEEKSERERKNEANIRAAHKRLDDWLEKVGAFCNWQLVHRGPGNRVHSRVEAWTANGRVFILVRFAGTGGWEIYTANDSIKIDDTFEDAERRLGLKKE